MSFNYTGSFSGSFYGDITSSNGVVSSSAQIIANLPAGIVSSSAQVNYTQVVNKPTTISAFQKNSITANNRFREVTYSTDSGSVSTRLTNLESFSSSLDDTYATDADVTSVSTRVTNLESFSSSLDATYATDADLSSVSSSLASSIGSISTDFSDITNKPSGLVSSSAQLPSGILSSSAQLPSGLVSSSAQIESEISGAFTSTSSSLASRISTLESATDDTGSDSQTLSFNSVNNNLTISDGNSVDLSSLAGGGGGGGSSIWSTGSDYYYVNANLQVTGSLSATSLTGSIDWNNVTNTPSGILSSSAQIAALGAGILSGSISTYDGAISSSAQIANLGAGIISSSDQITITTSSITNFDTEVSRSVAEAGFGSGGSSDTASYVEGVTNFDGNRIVSNTNLPSGIYNVNFGTSGSISNFIEEVFFPNTSPSISSSFFKVEEFEVNGTSIGTISATDAEGQTITFRTASSYTDDLFRIHSGSGEITINVKTTSSINDTNTPVSVKNPVSSSHLFPVEVVDTFNGVSSADIYIHINPNQAPVWRTTSVSGPVTTEFTHSLNESSTSGTNKVRVYVSDYESDTITIETGSLPTDFTNAFSLTVGATYVQLNQTTSSLDYENITGYNIVLTASDQHYQDGDDTTAITYLPYHVRVVDNVGPTVNNQTLSGLNENSSNGASAGTISATDSEGNSIIFSNFTLVEANLDGGSNITSSLGGNSLYDPHQDPFQVNANTGEVTRKDGVYLNSDVANNYIYRVTVNDAFNSLNDTGLITIPIADDAVSTIEDNWSNIYVIESATTGDEIKLSTNGRTGVPARWNSAVSQRWEIKSTGDLISLNSTTGSLVTLELASDLSGSAYASGSIISVELTASEHGFETTKQYVDQDIFVVINNSPSITFTNTSANLNTNGARSGSTLTTISFSDTEGDALNHNSFTFTDSSGQLNSIKSGDTYVIQANNNLSGSTYDITASIKDEHGFRTTTEEHTLTIAQAPIGTLTGDTTSYIIESAVSGAVLRTLTGYNNGNASDLGVTYSPQYNSAVVSSFTSSNSAIAVDGNGGLTLAVHLSGSSTGSGDTISTEITYQDQYGNLGSGSVTVNVFANQAPTATFSEVSANLTASISANTNLVSITISDTESDTPFSASLSGTDASKLKLVPQNANSSSYQLQASTTIESGDLNYTASVFDNFDKSREYNRTTTVAATPVFWYAYLAEVGVYATSEASSLSSYGDANDDGTIDDNYPFDNFADAEMGNAIISSSALAGITSDKSFLVASGSTLQGSRTSQLLTNINHNTGSNNNTGLLLVFPSSSGFTLPDSMTNSLGGSTAGEYVLYADRVGTGIVDAPQSAYVRYFDFNGSNTYPNSSATRFGVIFTHGDASTDIEYFLMASSGSAPSSTQ